MACDETSDAVLLPLLEDARSLGFLGSGPPPVHLAHSRAFAFLAPHAPDMAVDLGSGGGLPGLALALVWPQSQWVLLDANRRRSDFLQLAVDALHMGQRVKIRCQRAEEAGRDPSLRGGFDLVVARSFGPPGVTAECAAPLLKLGGHLIVAEPPGGDPLRWPPLGLALVGLQADRRTTEPWAMQRLTQASTCPARYPRRTGIPGKRPLFKNIPTSG